MGYMASFRSGQPIGGPDSHENAQLGMANEGWILKPRVCRYSLVR